jgi:hypothetical protein
MARFEVRLLDRQITKIYNDERWLLDTSNGDARRRAIQITTEGLRIWREALPC